MTKNFINRNLMNSFQSSIRLSFTNPRILKRIYMREKRLNAVFYFVLNTRISLTNILSFLNQFRMKKTTNRNLKTNYFI